MEILRHGNADGAVLGDEQFSFARNVLHQRSRHGRPVGVDINPSEPLVALLCLGGLRLEQEKKRHARIENTAKTHSRQFEFNHGSGAAFEAYTNYHPFLIITTANSINLKRKLFK